MSSSRGRMADLFQFKREEFARALGLACLYFLVICALGILRPLKNVFALQGLADSEFYKVYLVSAVVVLFVPLFNRMARLLPARQLIPTVSLFFVVTLLIFRVAYQEGSTVLGMLFYGWSDLAAAALVTQFFLATQVYFSARDAKRLYPVIIAGGSIGGTVAGIITGFFVQSVGTPNLLIVAAGALAIFALAVPFALPRESLSGDGELPVKSRSREPSPGWGTILGNPQVRLIVALVLLTVLVKQLVDYQFNTITKEVFQSRDAMTAFQGKFNATTQWLPFVVLAILQPLLRRWGVGVAVFLLPIALLGANIALATTWGIVAAVIAKGGDTAFRYTSERAGREILYVPIPDAIKLKAKAYIDMAVEKGIGKLLSALLIMVITKQFIDYHHVGYVAIGLCVVWLYLANRVRAEYSQALVASLRGRYAGLRGTIATLIDANTLAAVDRALCSDDEREIAFALDLLDETDSNHARPVVPRVHALLNHSSPMLRVRALRTLASFPLDVDWVQVRDRVQDTDLSVREEAVRLLCRTPEAESQAVLRDLLASVDPQVRLTVLACMASEPGAPGRDGVLDWSFVERTIAPAADGDPESRLELALALGAVPQDPRLHELLGPLLRDTDPRVATAALRTAGLVGGREYVPRLIAALGSASTRQAAGEMLSRQGEKVLGTLSDYLGDSSLDLSVRRNIPAVMARIPVQATVDHLLRTAVEADTLPLIRYRALRALNRIRNERPALVFDSSAVLEAVRTEADRMDRCAQTRATILSLDDASPVVALLGRTLYDAWRAGRERVFRYLALAYDPTRVYRIYLTLQGGTIKGKANALESLEITIGHTLFAQIAPALEEPSTEVAPTQNVREALRLVMLDRDVWIAACAIRVAVDLRLPWAREELTSLAAGARMQVAEMAGQALARLAVEQSESLESRNEFMNEIEKVFLLQRVDLLQDARTEDLVLLASIAEEMHVKAGTVLLRQDEPADALYIVDSGSVEIRREGEHVMTVGQGAPFGSWSLIDEAPNLFDATAVDDTKLLRISRQNFFDLLDDHHELVRGLLKRLARRVRVVLDDVMKGAAYG